MFEIKEKPKRIEELIEIAKLINDHNEKQVIFSGSFALELQGIQNRRPCGDLDIIMDHCHVFDLPETMKKTDDYDFIDEIDDYVDDEEIVRPFEIQAHRIKGVKVDLFIPNFSIQFHEHQVVKHESGLKLLHFSEIVKYKVAHSFGTAFSRFKHRDDIIFLLMKNIV